MRESFNQSCELNRKMDMMDDKKDAWNSSYAAGDNILFYPHEEVIRFFSKFIRKRIGLKEFFDVSKNASGKRVLDLGCGIGRHVIFSHEMGLDAYGIDISETAIKAAREWGNEKKLPEPDVRLIGGDVRHLPWRDGFFHYAVSHGVLDSMPFDIAVAACVELARVMEVGGLFYCDLISGDDSAHAREYSGEELVATDHEAGTLQYYFNFKAIQVMIADVFTIEECNLIRRDNILGGRFSSRYHLV
jgi:ubiquinone/menaquinone biosynthesis C-methylase UbiE